MCRKHTSPTGRIVQLGLALFSDKMYNSKNRVDPVYLWITYCSGIEDRLWLILAMQNEAETAGRAGACTHWTHGGP